MFTSLSLVVLATATSLQPASGAAGTTVVTMSVPSATSLDASGCAPASSGSTGLGTVMPDTISISTADCSLTFGSSNDTGRLLVFQGDGTGDAMARPSIGAPDTAWGAGGVRELAVGNAFIGRSYGMAQQGDGKLVFVGDDDTLNDAFIARLDATGALDATYAVGGADGNGILALDFGALPARAYAIVVDSRDRAYVVGTSGSVPTRTGYVARFTSDGVLDSTWDGDGIADVVFDPSGTDTHATFVQLDSRERPVVVGMTVVGGTNMMGIARFTTEGAPDTSFAGTGRRADAVLGGSGANKFWDAIAILPGDELLVAGQGDTATTPGADEWGVIGRYAEDGSQTWVEDHDLGSATSAFNHIGLDAQGRVYISGRGDQSGSDDAIVVRIDPATGALDLTYGGGDGIAHVDASVGVERGNSMHVHPDGRAFVVGRTGADLLMARFTNSGQLDTTFNSSGYEVVNQQAGANDRAEFVLPGIDGGYVTIGMGSNDRAYSVRRLGTAIPDWSPGVNDFDDGVTGAFGICLHTIGATASPAGSWLAAGSGNCTSVLEANWQSVPDGSSTTEAHVASANANEAAASIAFRFGLRPGAATPPGQYEAPVTFQVLAP